MRTTAAQWLDRCRGFRHRSRFGQLVAELAKLQSHLDGRERKDMRGVVQMLTEVVIDLRPIWQAIDRFQILATLAQVTQHVVTLHSLVEVLKRVLALLVSGVARLVKAFLFEQLLSLAGCQRFYVGHFRFGLIAMLPGTQLLC